MKIFLIRHGDTQRGENGVYGYSAPLTDLGHRQAKQTGEWLSNLAVTHVVASDAVRALQTAEPLSSALGIETTVIPELTEIDIGRPGDGVSPYTRKRLDEFVMDCSDMGGETWDVFRSRVLTGLDLLAGRFEPDATVAVFTHGGVKSVAIDHYSGREPSKVMTTMFENGSVSTVEGNGAGYIVHGVNEIAHLE